MSRNILAILVFSMCYTSAFAAPVGSGRGIWAEERHADVGAVRARIEGAAEALAELKSQRALIVKSSTSDRFLTRAEKAELLRSWDDFYIQYEELCWVAGRQGPSTIDFAPATGGADYELIGATAGVAKLVLGGIALDSLGDSRKLAVLLNQHPAGKERRLESYDAFRRSLSDLSDLGALLRFVRSGQGDQLLRVLQKGSSRSDGSWEAAYWQDNEGAVRKAIGGDLVKTWLRSTLQAPLDQLADAVMYPVVKPVALFLARTRVARSSEMWIAPEQLEVVRSHLQPGDIVLERASGYLADQFIKGFWGHAFLYLGTYDEAMRYFDTPEVNRHYRELGHPSFADYLQARFPTASSGWRGTDPRFDQPISVIEGEGLEDAVILNSFAGACNSDNCAGLRPRNLSRLDKAQAIAEALGYLGYAYDFDFDVHQDDALVCTELIARAYADADGKRGITFPVSNVFKGRHMVYPNEIARHYGEKKRGERDLEVVFFLKGVERERRAVLASESEFMRSARW